MCTKPREIKPRSVMYKGQKFQSVKVKGSMTAANIRSACEAQGLIPVCDHNSYADDYCWSSGISLHFSHPHHDPRLGVSVKKMRDIWFYTGRHGTGALLNTGTTHRWRKGYAN